MITQHYEYMLVINHFSYTDNWYIQYTDDYIIFVGHKPFNHSKPLLIIINHYS